MKVADSFHRIVGEIERKEMMGYNPETEEYDVPTGRYEFVYEAECTAPRAIFYDNVWDDIPEDVNLKAWADAPPDPDFPDAPPSKLWGYTEQPAGTVTKMAFRMQETMGKSPLDFEKYPVLGIECPCCALTRSAKQRFAEVSPLVSAGEEMLRQVLEDLYDDKFPNLRPSWLVNPNTNHNLELDCYNQKMNLAFEYQGLQHYEPIEFFGGQKVYEKTRERDKIKKEICQREGVRLIEIDCRSFPPGSKNKLRKHILSLMKDQNQNGIAV